MSLGLPLIILTSTLTMPLSNVIIKLLEKSSALNSIISPEKMYVIIFFNDTFLGL